MKKVDENNKWVFPHSYGSIYDIEEVVAALEVMKCGALTSASLVKEFERKFAEYVGGQFGVATNSWGGGAQLVADILELTDNDEVIVPAWTMSASANIFARSGARIIFADVNPDTFNIDPDKVEEKISKDTKAIVVVHMCGQPCEMDKIVEISKRYNIPVIQDAAHAPGAKYKNRKLGEFGGFVIYSFHQAKNIVTLGEGGMVVVNNKEWKDKLYKLRAHGMGEYIGYSNRMTEIQASVGLVQLKRLDEMNNKRRALSYKLSELLSQSKEIRTPYEIPNIYHTYHLYSIQVEKLEIEKLKRLLWIKGRIMTIAYFPTLNNLDCYRQLGHKAGECPSAEEAAAKTLVLPLSPLYSEGDIEEMANKVLNIVEEYK